MSGVASPLISIGSVTMCSDTCGQTMITKKSDFFTPSASLLDCENQVENSESGQLTFEEIVQTIIDEITP